MLLNGRELEIGRDFDLLFFLNLSKKIASVVSLASHLLLFCVCHVFFLGLFARADEAAGVPDGLQLDTYRPPQIVETIFKQLAIRLVKLIFHHGQIVDRQRQQFTLRLALDGELALQTVSEGEPVVDVEFVVVHETANDTRDAKMHTLIYLDVHQVVVTWQDVTGITVLMKVYATDVAVLEEDVLFF